MELGQLLIDVGISESSLSNIENKLKERAARISTFTLKSTIDDSALTKLNKHLDLKVSHLKEVNSYFTNNPITPIVNFNQTSRLKNELKSILDLQKAINSNRVVSSGGVKREQGVSISVPSSGSQSSSKTDPTLLAKDFTTQLLVELNKSVTNGFKKAINTFNPLTAFGKGAFERFGHSLTDDLVKGTKSAIKDLFDVDISGIVEQTIKKQGEPFRTKAKSTQQVNQQSQTKSSPENFYTPVSIPQQSQQEKVEEVIQNVKSANSIIKSITTKNWSKLVDESLNVVRREISKEKPNISTAETAFAKIRESFKSAYAQMNKALSSGNTNLAESYAKTIVSTSNRAFADIDQIVKTVASAGYPTNFGSPIKTLAGSTKGVLTSRYVNPSKRTLTNIGNRQEREEFITVGKQVVAGVKEGLTDTSPVSREVSNVTFTILNAFRKTLGIQSPSRRAYEIGQLIIEGLKLGVKGDIKGLRDVAGQIVKEVLPSKENVRKTIATVAPNLLPRTFAENRAKLEKEEEAYPDTLKSRRTNFLGFKDGKYVGLPNNYDYLNPKPGLGSVEFFEGLASKGARLGTKAMAKGFPTSDEPETVARQAMVMALTNKPEFIAGALASPLAVPLLPTYMAAKVARNILTPIATQVFTALQATSPVLLKLSNLAGSEAGGKRELGYVESISNKYGSDLKGGADAYSQISFATKGTKLEGDDTKKLFEGVSAATKYVGADASKASLIFQAFTQIISKGKVSMEELRLQLSESFPPAMQVFAKAIGKSVPELTDLISKGAILSEDILPKVADILLNDFSNGASSAAASFVQASNRMANAFFDFQLKISESFGGMVTGVINMGAGLFEGINTKLQGLGKAFNLLAISIIASTAAGFSTILGHQKFAGALKVIENLFTVTFRRTVSLFTPFIAGTFIDLIDDFFGVKNSSTDNVSKGVTNFITGIFTGIDSIGRSFNKKGLFSVGLTDKDTGMLDGLKQSMQSLFSVVPKGVVEMTALILMFQQCALLARAYVMPSLMGIANSLKIMGQGVLNAVANFGNMRDSLKDFFPMVSAQAKNVGGVLLGLGANVVGALAVMSLAQSDFSNPLQKSFDTARTRIKGSLDSISSDLLKLKLDAEGVGKSLREAITLPSKGMELSLFKILGLSEDSFKSDDLISKFNQSGFVKGATRFKDFLEEKTLPVEERQKTRREQKAKDAESLGLSGYVRSDDKYSTLAQDQLLNNVKDLAQQRKDLDTRLKSLNLSPSNLANFQTGGTKKTIDDLRAMDKEIYALSQRRAQLSLGEDGQAYNDPATKKAVATLDQQINALVEKRKVQGKGLSNIFGSVGDIKTQLQDQLKAIDDSNIPQSAKNALKDYVQPQIDEIDHVVEYLKQNKLYDLVKPLASVWQEVTDKLTTAENAFTRLQKSAKLTSLNAQAKIVVGNYDSESNKQQQLDTESLDNLSNQETQIASILKTRTESLQKLLTISNVETAPNSKEDIISLRENIDKDKENLAETRLQIAQARASLITKLKDQVKQVNEFYTSINRQVESQKIESQKIDITINATRQQTRLKEILSGGYDTIVDQFIEAIIASIELTTAKSTSTLDAQAQLLQNRNTLQDSLKAGNELAKTLPGYDSTKAISSSRNLIDANKIIQPVKAGFSSFSNEKADKEIINNAQVVSTQAITQSTNVLTQTSAQTNQIKQQVAETKNQLSGVQEISNSISAIFKSWVADIKTIPTIMKAFFESVNDSLNKNVTNVGISLGNFATSANDKIQSLVNVGNALGSSVAQIFTQSIPQLSSDIQQNVSNGIEQGISLLQDAASNVANAFSSINSDSIASLVGDFQTQITNAFNDSISIFNQGVQSTVEFFSGGIETVIGNTTTGFSQLTTDLNKGINDAVINFGNGINKGINDFVAGMGNAVNSIMEAIKNFASAIASFNPGQALQNAGNTAGDIATGAGDALYNGLGATQNWLANATGIGRTSKFSIYDSNNGSVIKSYDNLTRHHANRGRESGREYGIVGGKQEEINAQGMVKKDLVLKQNGADNVPVPSPATGYARTYSPLGQVGIYDKREGGNLLAKVLHLASFNVKEGQEVKYGQSLGIQGMRGGKSTGVHLHVEGSLELLKKYVHNLLEGDFSKGYGGSVIPQTSQKSLGNANMQDTRATVVDPRGSGQIASSNRLILNPATLNRGGNDLSPIELTKLTPKGRELYNLRKNPGILAIADVVARAEGTDFRENSKNYGYGMMIGGENTNDVTTHPFVGTGRKPRYNSTASGRYQMMNFNYTRTGQYDTADVEDIFQGTKAPSFSPGVQDLYFINSLKRRGVLQQALQGDISGVLNKSGINSLAANYASLENKNGLGYYRGQKTPEGMRSSAIPFGQARLQDRLRNNLSPAQQQNQIIGQTLQGGVALGHQQSQQLADQKDAQIRAQQDANAKRQEQEQRLQQQKAIRQLREQGRQLQIESRNDKKSSNDISFNAIFNPTTAQKTKKQQDDVKYEISDMLEAATHRLETVTKNRAEAEKAISSPDVPTEAKAELIKQLPGYKKAESDLKAHIEKIKALEGERLNFVKQTADREEALRLRDQSFSERQREIDLLQERINKLNVLKASQPFSPDVQQLPNLQKLLDLRKDELATDQERAKLKDDLFNHKIDQTSYDKQTSNLNQKSQLARDSIQVRSQQQLTQQEIDRIKRDNETRKSEQENFASSAQLNLQRLLDKPATTRPEDLSSARAQIYQSDVNAETINYEAKRLEYKQLEATDNSQPGHIKKLYEDLDKLHIANLDQLKAKYELTLAMDKSDNTKRQIETRTQINDQLDRINTGRLAEVERLISKTSDVSPIQTIRQSQYRQQTYNNSVNAQQQSYLEEKNKIDDLEINNKRTPAQIKELRENLEALNNISLNGFKTTLKDALDTDAISRFQKRIDLLTNQQYLESSDLDLRKAKIAQDTTRSSNPFAINSRQRNVARDEENNRYTLELLELDKKMADLRSTGVNIPDKAINNIKENLFQIHSINLDNLNDQFKTFGSTIDDIAKTGLQGLSQSLADVITEGGDLGSVFNNLFKTIANGFIKNGLDSLIGGLTGSLFGGGNKKSSGLGGGILDFVGGIFGGDSGGGLLSILGFAEGGTVPAVSGQSLRSTATQIGQALRKEGSNAVLATLTPGERVLTTKENEIYNLVHPGGIEASYKALNFNEGGNVGEMSRQVTNKFNSIGTTTNSPVINIQKDENPDLSGVDKQSVKMIRAVVVAEMKRQNAPGGINNRSK